MSRGRTPSSSTVMVSTCRDLVRLPCCTNRHLDSWRRCTLTCTLHRGPFGYRHPCTWTYLGNRGAKHPSLCSLGRKSRRQSRECMSRAWCWQRRLRRWLQGCIQPPFAKRLRRYRGCRSVIRPISRSDLSLLCPHSQHTLESLIESVKGASQVLERQSHFLCLGLSHLVVERLEVTHSLGNGNHMSSELLQSRTDHVCLFLWDQASS